MATTESPEASTPNSQPNIVADAEDFLRERSDLLVQYEESNQGMTFVARTSDDRRAQIEDFPKNFSKHTFIHYRTVLRDFLDVVDVTDLSDVTPREISRFAKEMQRDDLARTTRDKKLEKLEVFFKWAESEWRAPTDERKLSDAIARKRENMNVSGDEYSRAGEQEHVISADRANEVLDDLTKYEYASRRMTEFLLIWHVGLRQSAVLSLNVGDVHPRKGIIEVRNRPEEADVRLKRGDKGERDVNVGSDQMAVIMDYIENNRLEPDDGSDALFTSSSGRIVRTTLYRDITSASMCDDCDLTKREASKCDESVGPHDLRRSAITHMRDEGIAWETIGGRVNADSDTLKKHYDDPTHEQAAQRRRNAVLRSL